MLTQWSSARSSASSHGQGEQWSLTQRQPRDGPVLAIAPPLTFVLSRSSLNSFRQRETGLQRLHSPAHTEECSCVSTWDKQVVLQASCITSRENASYSLFVAVYMYIHWFQKTGTCISLLVTLICQSFNFIGLVVFWLLFNTLRFASTCYKMKSLYMCM